MKTFLASVTVFLTSAIMGCGDVTFAPDVLFPQDYETSFTKLGACRPSAAHSNPFYLFRITASSAEAFNAGMPLPEGTVLVKTQYNDSECTDLVVWTVMKKREAGYDPMNWDWEWQNVDQDGQVKAQGKVAACSSCHAACPEGVCTTK